MGIKHFLQQVKHEQFLRKLDKETRAKAKDLRRSQQATYKQVAAHMEIPRLDIQPKSIVGLAMVKNEVDIIESTLKNLFTQGVDHILIVDNGSTDGTLELLKRLALDYPLTVGLDKLQAYEQSAKMTFLFDQIKGFKPQWVIPFDADEFWLGTEGSIAECLRSSKYPIQKASIYNAFPATVKQANTDKVDIFGSQWNIDSVKHHDPKVAFKPWPETVIEMGNHSVLRGGKQGNDLRIIHFPWRSLAQFKRKVAQGAQALALTDIPEENGQHWRTLSLLDDAQIEKIFRDLIAGKPIPGNAWNPIGTLHPLKLSEPLKWRAINPEKA